MAEELQQDNNQVPQKGVVIEPDNPADRLGDILRGINEAHLKENSAMELSLYKEAEELFKTFTGQDLMEKAVAAAQEEVESEGSKMVSKQAYFSDENFKKEVEAFKFKQQTLAVEKGWQKLSETEKKLYLNDINNFISAIEKKIEELKKNGFGISKEIFYNVTANGYMLLNMKKSFFRGRILVPVLIGDGAYKFETLSLKEFENSVAMMQSLFDLTAKQAVEDKLSKESLYAKRRWHKRKMRKVREILKAVSKTLKEEEIQEEEKKEIRKRLELKIRGKIQKEVEAEERASLEKLSNIGEVGVLERLKGFEQLEKKTDKNIKKEIEKMGKSLEKDIQERTKDEEKIDVILKKQMEKGRISKKRMTYLGKATKGEENKSKENISPTEETTGPIENAAPMEEAPPPVENIGPAEVATPVEEKPAE